MDERDAVGNWSKFIVVDGVEVASRSFRLFSSMLSRCNFNQSYSDVVVHPDFQDYHFFARWCMKQKGYEFVEDGHFWHLDKDLLGKDLRTYSPETCVFLPRAINNLISLECIDKFEHESRVRNLAEKYKKYLSEKAYQSLMKWEP